MSELLRRKRLNLVTAGLLAGSLLIGGACSAEKDDYDYSDQDDTEVTEYIPTAEDLAEERRVINERRNEFKENTEGIVERLSQADMTAPVLLPDGRRITIVPTASSNYYYEEPAVKTEYCSGPNLEAIFEEIEDSSEGYTIVGDVHIETGNAWCVDGKLTEADFAPVVPQG